MKFCPNCGKPIDDRSTNCPNCGAFIDTGTGRQNTQANYSQPNYQQPNYQQGYNPNQGYGQNPYPPNNGPYYQP